MADGADEQGEVRDRRSVGAALVVVAVLVLALGALGGLGYTAFWRARERARQASCASNIKSIGLDLAMYATDYGDRLPPPGDWQVSLDGYVANQQEYVCPSALGEPGYAYNHRLDSFAVKRLSVPAEAYLGWDAGAAPPGVTPLPGTTANRHLGGDNFVFADGRAKWLSAGEVPTGGTTDPAGPPRGGGAR